MIESIKPIICLEEGIVALLLKVDRQILPKVVGARYGSKAELAKGTGSSQLSAKRGLSSRQTELLFDHLSCLSEQR
jgi:hypothetical protein